MDILQFSFFIGTCFLVILWFAYVIASCLKMNNRQLPIAKEVAEVMDEEKGEGKKTKSLWGLDLAKRQAEAEEWFARQNAIRAQAGVEIRLTDSNGNRLEICEVIKDMVESQVKMTDRLRELTIKLGEKEHEITQLKKEVEKLSIRVTSITLDQLGAGGWRGEMAAPNLFCSHKDP